MVKLTAQMVLPRRRQSRKFNSRSSSNESIGQKAGRKVPSCGSAPPNQDSLLAVRNLNKWASDLDDISILEQMPNVEVLSLSVNHIATLAHLKNCCKLRELYLRKNDITSLSELQNIQHIKSLRILWLSDNPCAQIKNYRQVVLSMLPQLTKLDDTDITEEERQQASKGQPTQPTEGSERHSVEVKAAKQTVETQACVKSSTPPTSTRNTHIMTAIMSLLEEVSVDDLRLVRSRCDTKITNTVLS